MIDPDRVREALREHADWNPDRQRWFFPGPPGSVNFGQTDQAAMAVVEACLILDVPVTDILLGSTWLRVIQRVAAMEERLAALEADRDG